MNRPEFRFMGHTTDHRDTANAVRVAIASREWTTQEAAAAAGISPAAMSRKLNRRNAFTAPELHRLADALGVPASDLIGDVA